MNSTWPIQDGKTKLSELLDTVLKHGAQTITRHGKPVVVVISAEAYAHLQPAEKLVDGLSGLLTDRRLQPVWVPSRYFASLFQPHHRSGKAPEKSNFPPSIGGANC